MVCYKKKEPGRAGKKQGGGAINKNDMAKK